MFTTDKATKVVYGSRTSELKIKQIKKQKLDL